MFKNLMFMRFPQNYAEREDFTRAVKPYHTASDPGPLELRSVGLTQDDDGLCHTITLNGYLIHVETRERKIPKAALDKRVADIIRNQYDNDASPRLRKRVKREVLDQMLPHAPIVPTRTPVLVVPSIGLLAIGSASPREAEKVCSLLRDVFASFPAVPISTDLVVSAMLTAAAKDVFCAVVEHYTVDPDLLWLKDFEGRTAKFKQRTEDSTSVADLLADGMKTQRISLCFGELLYFTLDDDLRMRSIKLGDGGEEAQADTEDAALLDEWVALTLWRGLSACFQLHPAPPPLNGSDLA